MHIFFYFSPSLLKNIERPHITPSTKLSAVTWILQIHPNVLLNSHRLSVNSELNFHSKTAMRVFTWEIVIAWGVESYVLIMPLDSYFLIEDFQEYKFKFK